jgi:hypothetical protein
MEPFNTHDPGHRRFLKRHNGYVAELVVDEYVDLTFTSMADASSWVDAYGYQERAVIVGTVNFAAPVTIRVSFE